MVEKRIIPFLLLHNGKLVKTIQFSKERYIGNPINAVKIFNEKEVDELMFVDIFASYDHKDPNYDLITEIAEEAFMPVGYGGGIKTCDQMKKIFASGIEKIILNSIVAEKINILEKAAKLFGRQSIVVSMDLKKNWLGRYEIRYLRGKKKIKFKPREYAKLLENSGAGEIIIQNITLDGTMKGYDIELINEIAESVNIPVVALGGASSLADLKKLFKNSDVSAAACGSLFVYQSNGHGVLINYPNNEQKKRILRREYDL